MSKSALETEVHEGSLLFPDAGFTCMGANEPKVVRANGEKLFVECSRGKHYLDGQYEASKEGWVLSGLSFSRWEQVKDGEKQDE